MRYISAIKVDLIKTLVSNLKERFITDIYFQNLNMLLN